MITPLSDCRTTYFERKVPVRIEGEPTFEQLTQLYENVKINAQAVPSTLGGGRHGHLGLVVTPTQYQMLSLVPFHRPANPGPFTLTPQQITNMTPEQRNELRQLHQDALVEFHQVEQVDSALKQYITDSVPEDYLLELRNDTTKKLTGTIPQIMQHLFSTYGNLTAPSLVDKQNQLLNYVYDVTKPIDVIFNLAKEYQEFQALFGTTVPAEHIITMVYNILRKTGKFRGPLEKWNEKPPQDKTWANFKLHFRRAAKNLREFSIDTAAAQAGYSQQMVNEITNGLYNIMMSTTEGETTKEAETFMNHMAAAVQQNQTILPQIMQSVATMNQNMSNMQEHINTLNNANAARNQQRGSNNQQPPAQGQNHGQQQQQQQGPPQQFGQFPLMPPPAPFCMPTNMPFQQMPFMPQFQQQQQQYQGGHGGGGRRNRRGNNRSNNNREDSIIVGPMDPVHTLAVSVETPNPAICGMPRISTEWEEKIGIVIDGVGWKLEH